MEGPTFFRSLIEQNLVTLRSKPVIPYEAKGLLIIWVKAEVPRLSPTIYAAARTFPDQLHLELYSKILPGGMVLVNELVG